MISIYVRLHLQSCPVLDLSSPRVYPTRPSVDSTLEKSNSEYDSETTNSTYLTRSSSSEIVTLSSFRERNYNSPSRSPLWLRNTVSSSAKKRSKSLGHKKEKSSYPVSDSSSLDLTMNRQTAKRLAREDRIRRRRMRAIFRPEETETESPSTSQVEDDEEEEIQEDQISDEE